MKKSARIVLFLLFTMLIGSLISNVSFADEKSTISIELDKTTAKVGDTIKASLNINNIKNFNSYQVCIRYNPTVLQAVDPTSGKALEDKTAPADGNILLNAKFSPLPITTNNIQAGMLNFGKTYMNLQAYKSSGTAESTGTVAVIGFKVLKDAAADIVFDDLGTIPNSIHGTMLFDWDGNQILSGYEVVQPAKINSASKPEPLPSYTVKPAPQAQASVAPASSSDASSVSSPASSANSDNSNSSKTNDSSSTKKSSLVLIIVVLSAVVVLIPTVIVVLMLKRKK
ncbi:MAG: cohesin domain-containing protein [Bacillota bacterium]|nr:cohesin domain-containing protein [Bacillota bacterium]